MHTYTYEEPSKVVTGDRKATPCCLGSLVNIDRTAAHAACSCMQREIATAAGPAGFPTTAFGISYI